MKKALSLFLAFICALSCFTEVFAGTSLTDAMAKVNLYSTGTATQLLTFQGIVDPNNFAPHIIVYKADDGKEYPAYCIQPRNAGVDTASGKNYDVDVDSAITNPQVWSIITNGHPYKTPSELGVTNEYEAYYITKIATWMAVYDHYGDINDWKANGAHNKHVEDALNNKFNRSIASSLPSRAQI